MENINAQQNSIENFPQQSLQPTIMSSSPPRKLNKLIILTGLAVILIIFIAIVGYYYLSTNKNLQPVPKEITTQNLQTNESEGYYAKFIGPSGRFSFEHPQSLKLDKNEAKGEYIFKHPQDFITVAIAEQTYSIIERDIEKNFSVAFEKQKQELEAKGYINFSESQFKKSDKYFFRLDYTRPAPSPLEGIKVKSTFLYIVKPNTFYSVSIGAFESYIKDLEHIIQTFE